MAATPEMKMMGRRAAERARVRTLELLESKGPGLDKIIKTLDAALEANTQKVFFKHNGYTEPSEDTEDTEDTDPSKPVKDTRLVYSEKLVDHATRLKAVSIGLELYDVMPDKRSEVTVTDEYEGMTEAEIDQAIKAFNDRELDRPLTAADLLGLTVDEFEK